VIQYILDVVQNAKTAILDETMCQISKPLDRSAVQSADERLYAAHENDPRENAFFDAAGRREPLDASDPDQEQLRQEWRKYYCDALQAKQGRHAARTPKAAAARQTSPADPPPQEPPVRGSQREVGKASEPCPNCHWIVVRLWPDVDTQTWPVYWPFYPVASLYSSEPFTAEITDGHREANLDFFGGFEYRNIPAGMCKFRVPEFLTKIKADMLQKSKYPASSPS
jgi:hypothetical protein